MKESQSFKRQEQLSNICTRWGWFTQKTRIFCTHSQICGSHSPFLKNQLFITFSPKTPILLPDHFLLPSFSPLLNSSSFSLLLPYTFPKSPRHFNQTPLPYHTFLSPNSIQNPTKKPFKLTNSKTTLLSLLLPNPISCPRYKRNPKLSCK